jgi:hypothetical protein
MRRRRAWQRVGRRRSRSSDARRRSPRPRRCRVRRRAGQKRLHRPRPPRHPRRRRQRRAFTASMSRWGEFTGRCTACREGEIVPGVVVVVVVVCVLAGRSGHTIMPSFACYVSSYNLVCAHTAWCVPSGTDGSFQYPGVRLSCTCARGHTGRVSQHAAPKTIII